MQHIVKSFVAALACAALLSGCASGGGARAGELQWPRVDGDRPQGLYPEPDGLRAMRTGLGKDQVRGLIGSPHFRTAMHGVREWNYLFRFAEGGGDTACQYKVLFGADRRVSALHWKDAACEAYARRPEQPPALQPVAVGRPLVLPADTLFAFNQWTVDRILPRGVDALTALTAQLKSAEFADTRITVTGHADRIGGEAANRRLSQRRADSVRAYLIGAGIDGARIDARGVGQAQPLVQCAGQPERLLIACLAPNRRVEIAVSGADRG